MNSRFYEPLPPAVLPDPDSGCGVEEKRMVTSHRAEMAAPRLWLDEGTSDEQGIKTHQEAPRPYVCFTDFSNHKPNNYMLSKWAKFKNAMTLIGLFLLSGLIAVLAAIGGYVLIREAWKVWTGA